MTVSIVIAGLTPDDKVPGAYRETKYGQGKVSIGSLPVYLTLLGTKLTSGTATVDADVLDITSVDDADAFFGAGSELARGCYKALDIPGVNLRAAPVAENGSAVAATLVYTVTGSWTTGGQIALRLGGKVYRVAVGPTDTVTNVATNLKNAINSDSRLFCSAANAAGVLTLTVKSKGIRGNQWIAFQDKTGAPAGLVGTFSTGTAVPGGGSTFGSGAGADDVTLVLALLDPELHDYIAPAQNDATNVDLVRDQINLHAGPLVGQLEHMVVAHNGTQTNATSLAQTTLNEQRAELVWYENCESSPFEIASQWGAIRATTEGANPNPDYDDRELPTIAPQVAKADLPNHSELKAALNNGVTPLKQKNGKVVCVRAIVTHSLNGSTPDYRTLDVGDAIVPDRVSKELAAEWETFKIANPYVGPDPDINGGEDQAPEGVGTPSLWRSIATQRMKEFEAKNWVQDVDANPVQAEFDDEADRIMSAVPTVVRKINHQIGISVRQVAA